MASCLDFVAWLGPDTSTAILMRLDHPADLARLCCVSRSWHQFVVANGLCKNLCLRMNPELSKIVDTVELNSSSEINTEVECGVATEWKSREREHRVYAYLSRFLVSSILPKKDCIIESISASSTDRYPFEGIENTLVPSDDVNWWRPSYWSSKGETDPRVPATLTYRLNSRLCVVEEIKIKPFKVTFHDGDPIYSAETVRFRMGYLRYDQEKEMNADDNYVWLYVSPEYPMAQWMRAQRSHTKPPKNATPIKALLNAVPLRLPRPVICIGGIVQIELTGRVQRCYIDDLYYICISYVQVLGLPLSQVDILESSGNLVLKYCPGAGEHLEGKGAP